MVIKRNNKALKKKARLDPMLSADLSQYRPEELETLELFVENLKRAKDNPRLIMANFSRFVGFRDITKFLVMYEIHKLIRNVHGSIIELGVLNGFNLFSFAHFSEIFEPRNFTRQIIGFDTFSGVAGETEEDDGPYITYGLPSSDFRTFSLEDLEYSVEVFNRAIQFNQFEKILLVKGNAINTIPNFVEEHPELIVSVLICLCDIYAPTKTALEYLWPRMPKGGVVVFGSTNFQNTSGETKALHEILDIGECRIRRFEFATKFAYVIKE